VARKALSFGFVWKPGPGPADLIGGKHGLPLCGLGWSSDRGASAIIAAIRGASVIAAIRGASAVAVFKLLSSVGKLRLGR
jgi:hypothetical protein